MSTSLFRHTGAGLLAAGAMICSSYSSEAAGLAPQPTICQRACWSARAPSGSISQESSLNRAIVHHTAGQGDYNITTIEDAKANVRATQNYHMDTNGWADIGYHFLCDKLGNIFEGRAGSMTSLPRGAHDGANTASFGFNIMGYYHTPYNQVPTAESLDALYDIIAWRMPGGWAGPYGTPNCTYGSQGVCVGYVDSHRRVKATACPGDLLHTPYIGNDVNTGVIRDEIQLRMNGGGCSVGIPGVPSGVAASAATPYQVNVTWIDNAVDEAGFKIYRSGSAGGPYSQVGSAGVNQTSFTDNTAAPNTSYYYVVRSHNCAGESANSNEGSATTPVSNDIIVDNPGASMVGSWTVGTSAADKYGSDYRYKAGGDSASYLQFTPNVPEAAEYNVYEWHSVGTNRTAGAAITIAHAGGTAAVGINQQANGGRWNLLGRYTFNAGTGGHARITSGHTDTAQVVIADAIKFEKVGPPPAPTAVHVNSITMSWVKSGKSYKARTVVNVKNAAGANVGGATVTGNYTGSIAESGKSAVTDASGNATITSTAGIASGTVTFTVTDITGAGLTYDPAANVLSSGTITR